jgi:hypothetical protein
VWEMLVSGPVLLEERWSVARRRELVEARQPAPLLEPAQLPGVPPKTAVASDASAFYLEGWA